MPRYAHVRTGPPCPEHRREIRRCRLSRPRGATTALRASRSRRVRPDPATHQTRSTASRVPPAERADASRQFRRALAGESSRWLRHDSGDRYGDEALACRTAHWATALRRIQPRPPHPAWRPCCCGSTVMRGPPEAPRSCSVPPCVPEARGATMRSLPRRSPRSPRLPKWPENLPRRI